MDELPFELYKHHKYQTKFNWKRKGLIFTKEEFLEIYNRYSRASNCELCGNLFKSPNDRCMNHCHETGKFINIVCREQCINSIMEELPFKLAKCHKPKSKYQWKKRGLIFTEEEFQEIYNRYIWASHCELCGNAFKSSSNRHMEHCHATGKFRNIVCTKCNAWKSDIKIVSNTGEMFISKVKSKRYNQDFHYRIQIIRDDKFVLSKITKTLEEAIEIRDKFIAEHPEYFK